MKAEIQKIENHSSREIVTQIKSLSRNSIKRKNNGIKKYSEGTIDQSIFLSKTFNEWNSGESIDIGRAKTFLLERLERKSFETVKREKSILKLLLLETFPELNTHLGQKRIDLEFSEIHTPETNNNKRIYTLTEKELKETLPKFTHRQSLFIRFLYNSACRVSEMISIKLNNCKEQGEETFIHIIGKGSKGGILRVSTKLFNEIKEEFKGETYLFENHSSRGIKNKKGKQFSRQYVFEIVSKFEKFTGKPFSPHKLRHSRATNLLKAGETLSGVSELLRHSNKSTTTKFYDHSDIDTSNLLKGEI